MWVLKLPIKRNVYFFKVAVKADDGDNTITATCHDYLSGTLFYSVWDNNFLTRIYKFDVKKRTNTLVYTC